jgi:hypothetical protein
VVTLALSCIGIASFSLLWIGSIWKDSMNLDQRYVVSSVATAGLVSAIGGVFINCCIYHHQ